MSGSVPSGDGDGMDECIDPRLTLLTLDGAVSTHDLVDNGEWSLVEDGSARSPSVVHSPWTPSTDSTSSWYAGSVTGSSNDVAFSPPGMEQDSLAVLKNPTGLGAGPGDTMHDIAATGQHGAFEVMPVSWNMGNPVSANDLAALQASYTYNDTLNQIQLDMSQIQDFNFNTTHSIPNPQASMMQSTVNPSSET